MAIHPGLGRKKAWADAGCLLVTFCNSSLVAKVNVSEVPIESNSVADTLILLAVGMVGLLNEAVFYKCSPPMLSYLYGLAKQMAYQAEVFI